MEGQLKRMQDCGIDRLMFSPQAGAMGHHFRFAASKPLLDRGVQRFDRAGRQAFSG